MNAWKAAGTIAQFALGVLFLAASLSKLGDLNDFANQVNHYRLAPVAWVNLIAMVTPWVELLTGLSLVLRVKPRAGAFVALVMMIVFTIAVAAGFEDGVVAGGGTGIGFAGFAGFGVALVATGSGVASTGALVTDSAAAGGSSPARLSKLASFGS